MERNIERLFIVGTREKYRFETIRGLVSIEDLWDMPLTSQDGFNLDEVAKNLYKKTKDAETISFVRETSKENQTLQNKLDIVVYIIKTKMQEKKEQEEAAIRKAKKEKLMKILEEKEMEQYKNMDLDELKKMVEEL